MALTETPAAALLARCVVRGAVSQVEMDRASSGLSPAFSSKLLQAEQRIGTQRQLDELQLKMELLKVEKRSADVTHTFYLAGHVQELQLLCCHLQDVLKQQNQLRQRLMKPLTRTNLPVQAHLHRLVVEVVEMLLDLIQSLEEKLALLRSCSGGPAASQQQQQQQQQQQLVSHMTHDSRMFQWRCLNASVAQLMEQVLEMESLSSQVLRWREVPSSLSHSATWCSDPGSDRST
ncbi:HAUS augmin-like complex subunit 2 [Nelusetta ayraudi]|uniref:HAUS augmin-like complex subunit 2 n=1 Tax=Nelusetta ayraudi TaxID=303726 RepID=UPI003F704DF2